jgi:REP element-mobilizing transposase RayT
LKKGFRGWHKRGFLPHFDAPEVTQFVTFQLHDSFPVTRRAEFEAILKNRMILRNGVSLKRGWISVMASAGFGGMAEIIEEADGRDYRMQAWAVIPNHVHLVVEVWEVPLVKLITSWKGKSSRLANLLLRRGGKFWQEDYYDTLIRDEAHLKRAVRYTEQNPVKGFLTKAARDCRGAPRVIATNTNACRGSASHRRGILPLQPEVRKTLEISDACRVDGR